MKRRERITVLIEEITGLAAEIGRPVKLMEVCGTHTVNAARSGLPDLLPSGVRLVSGPGCPVCVTPSGVIDALVELGLGRGVILATYGDLVRVTGASGSLERARSEGADVRVVTSTLEVLGLARKHPDREVVFAAVGFETTAPATAVAVLAAEAEGLGNLSLVSAHRLVVPAMEALAKEPDLGIEGFLCPGHVSVVIGAEAYRGLVEERGLPCAVAGFTAEQILAGVAGLLRDLAEDRPRLRNLYPEVVRPEGNPRARELLAEVFTPADSPWRALGEIPASGLVLRPVHRRFDALERFGIELGEDREIPGCLCGGVITGRADPADCSLFGIECTPVDPVGPCMVSSEGSCRAWYRFRRREARP